MFRFIGLIVGCFALLGLVGKCDRQDKACPDGKCRPVKEAEFEVKQREAVLPKDYRWKRMHATQDWLYEGETLLGAWDHSWKGWVAWEGDRWSKDYGVPPIDPPINPEKAPTGARFDKVEQAREIITTSEGSSLNFGEFRELMDCPNCPKPPPTPGQPDKIPSDAQNVRLTIWSAEAPKREALLKEFKTSEQFSPFRERVNVWCVPPNHWSLEAGFPTEKDGLVIQGAGGHVLWRQEDLTVGKLIQGLRRAVPDYDRKKDPGMLDGILGLISDAVWVRENAAFLAVGVIGLGALLLPKSPTAPPPKE